MKRFFTSDKGMASARALFISLALLLAAWSYLSLRQLQAAKAEAERISVELALAKEITAKIEALSQKPRAAEKKEISFSDLTRDIEEAALQAGIKKNQIVRIEPEPARSLGGGNYMEKSTQVETSGVPLLALLSFLREISAEGRGLRVKSLRLKSPYDGAKTAGETGGETWESEIELSYLIYAPEEEK